MMDNINSVYDILNQYNLYNDISDTIYHLNITQMPFLIVLSKIAPHRKMTLKEAALLLHETIKLCDITSPTYNYHIDNELTSFGINYKVNKEKMSR